MRQALIVAAFCALACAVSLLAYGPLESWYPGLAKPAWAPPNAVFPATWAVTYLLWGLGNLNAKSLPLALAAAAIATLPPILFFAARIPVAAAIAGAIALLAVLAHLLVEARAKRTAALLGVAPLAWLAVQTVLVSQVR